MSDWKTPNSDRILETARNFLPGGVNSPVRSFRSVGGKAFVAAKGNGPYIYDVDGHELIDLVCSWGALIHGHNHPHIQSNIEKALKDGTSFGITCELEVELSELIHKHVRGMDMLRLVNSGTEACMSAIRLARGYTGRTKILKFEGTYHGHGDSFLVAAGSGAATHSISGSDGIPSEVLSSTMVLQFNDEKGLDEVFSKHGKEMAAVILEVVCGNMGVVLPQFSFLKKLHDLCRDHGAILIFDEVMTGFRLGLSGVQDIYGLEPDLSCLGKVIGGGLPVGAYGGKRKIMEKISPLGPVYQAGTLSGNPLGAAAGKASIEIILKDPKHFYQQLDAKGAEWKNKLEAHIRMRGYEVSVAQAGSMLSLFFCEKAPTNYLEVKASNIEKFKAFFWSLLKRGVYFPPSAFEACFISMAHTEEIMEKISKASCDALDEVFRGSSCG